MEITSLKGQRDGRSGAHVVGMCSSRMRCCLQRSGTGGVEENGESSGVLEVWWCPRVLIGGEVSLQRWVEIDLCKPPGGQTVWGHKDNMVQYKTNWTRIRKPKCEYQ